MQKIESNNTTTTTPVIVAPNEDEEQNHLSPYMMFKYSIRSELTRKYYERRLRRFLDFIQFKIEIKDVEERSNDFAKKSKNDISWTLNQIIRFLQFQKQRVENKEITAATLKNFIKSLKIFCESADLDIPWKKITRGLPKKDGIDKPIFDYEMELVNALDNNKSVFVKKARGLGITEILLRYMSWLAVFDSTYHNCRFHIVTGPRINLAEELTDRIRLLFQNCKARTIEVKQVGPIVYVNNVTIQAFPSHTVSTMRGYTDVKFIFIDEGAFFAPGQQEEVRAVCEGYRAKTNPHIVMVSTPYKPGDLFEQIDRDPNSIFKKLSYHYSVGLGKIYNEQEIEKERSQPYFRREFELAYSVGTGNVFTEQSIQAAEELGRKYTKSRISFEGTQKSLGIDPGFGSSKTAFTVIECVDNLAHVIYSKQFENSSTEHMVRHAYNLIRQYNLNNGINKVFIDGSQPGFIRSLKIAIGEYAQYEHFGERAKQDKREDKLYLYMNIIPVNFSTKHRAMLGNVRKWIDKSHVAIDPDLFPELLTELRIATSDEEMSLDKTEYSMDLLVLDWHYKCRRRSDMHN